MKAAVYPTKPTPFGGYRGVYAAAARPAEVFGVGLSAGEARNPKDITVGIRYKPQSSAADASCSGTSIMEPCIWLSGCICQSRELTTTDLRGSTDS